MDWEFDEDDETKNYAAGADAPPPRLSGSPSSGWEDLPAQREGEDWLCFLDLEMLSLTWSEVLPGVDYGRAYERCTVAVEALRRVYREHVTYHGPHDRFIKLATAQGVAYVGSFLGPDAWLQVVGWAQDAKKYRDLMAAQDAPEPGTGAETGTDGEVRA